MNLNAKLAALGTTLLLIVAVYSYSSFTNYSPKSLIPLREVQGTKSEDDERVKLPLPESYKLIGRTQKDGNQHITYQTEQLPEDIQTFYRNIMISKDWSIESTGNAGIFTTTKYVSGKREVSVTTSRQELEDNVDGEITIVSLFIKN